ncbi:MAG TPA: CDGSH iron-sulfur domain-containing protein [Methylophilaceae bacterium]|nr:CDGSH iron-sulfur domain-containing protein [Methylophilaceae bacterium]
MAEVLRAASGPFPVDVEQGKTYYWCACGRSKSQPFCDGSHQGTGLGPIQYEAEEDETIYFCGCKQSDSPPFCDGSHAKKI